MQNPSENPDTAAEFERSVSLFDYIDQELLNLFPSFLTHCDRILPLFREQRQEAAGGRTLRYFKGNVADSGANE